MNRKISVCLATLMMSISSAGISFAEDLNSLNASDPLSVYTVTDNSIINDKDYSIKPNALGIHTKETVVQTQRKNNVFCGYAVGTWQKASSYDSGTSYSASQTINIFGMSTSVSVSKYASATIPANPKRYSRLGAYADITFKKVKIETYQGGHPKPSVRYRVDKVYHNKYLKVVYK